jgi:hypothetical protein
MRRNSENLLVLAGHDSSRRWNQPVPLVDVLRAAISEIEQYERVTLNVQPGIAVRGPAVNDVVHLLAELAENATSFSSADTPVSVSGHLLSSGGVLLDITDQGVGMGSEEMAHANWRLDNPPVVDVAVSRRMGLFVVARLAARHGIRVRLRPATGTGLTALVWLPDEVVVHESLGRSGGPGRIGEQIARPAIGPAGPEGSVAGDWRDAGRLAAEDQVAAARAPRFAALRPDGGSPLGPQRVPGAGPRPGRPGETPTGPLPAVGDEPPAGYGETQPFVADEPPVAASDRSANGPMPVIGADQPSMPDWSVDSVPASPVWPDQAEFLGGPPEAGQSEQSEQPAQSAQSVFGAPVAAVHAFSGTFRTQDYAFRSADGEVIVPPPASLGEENRLPIFEAVESDWFRRGRPTVEWQSGQDEFAPGRIWTSPADEGWRAAEAAAVPASGGLTSAGLPRRVPQANLIPGTAAEIAVPVPVRSAAATRERFASLQRGMREGRAASGSDKDGTIQDVPGDG